LDAETPSEYSKANAELNKAMTQLNVVVENYPEIKANENFLKLQDELAGTENRLAVARMDYNEEVKRFNSKTRRFPTNIIANMFGFEKKVYFEINEEDAKVPEVNF
jgi:LemA protein